jgi:preprotein translocase subunit Sec63
MKFFFSFCFLKNDVVTNQSTTWKNLTAVRAAFIVVAWFIVSIHVKNDRLRTMIKNTEDKAFYEELKIEQNTVPLAAGLTSA